MQQNPLQELYLKELQNLYYTEEQIIKALPKMAKKASSQSLRSAIEEHLEQTKTHANRLERIFDSMGEDSKAKKAKGINGIIDEGEDIMDEDLPEATLDAGIIAAAQKVEHYEISSYGTVRNYANLLGQQEAVSLLEQTLEEEKQTDQKLTTLAQSINVQGMKARGASL